jgi:sugar-specific transcriptional regulator TrmB
MNTFYSLLSDTFSLTEREIAVVKHLIESGNQPASRVAKACAMPRNTTRYILDKLVSVGLASRTLRTNTQFYAIESQQSVLAAIEQRREAAVADFGRKIALIKEHGAVLDSSSSKKERPKIQFYDGYDGVKRVYEDSLTATTDLRAWASFDSNQQAMPRYFETYYSRRAKRGLSMKAIHPDTPLARRETKKNSAFLRRSVLVPSSQFDMNSEIQLYENKVNIVSWREKFGIIIQSEEIATVIAQIFDVSYQALKSEYGERK